MNDDRRPVRSKLPMRALFVAFVCYPRRRPIERTPSRAPNATMERGQVDASANVLTVSNLSVSYGHVAAVHDVSFEVAEGDCVALVGPERQRQELDRHGYRRARPPARTRRDLRPRSAKRRRCVHGPPRLHARARAPPALPAAVRRRQHHPRLLQPHPQPAAKAEASEAYRPGARAVPRAEAASMRQKAGTLSGGEQQMVAIARGLAADPGSSPSTSRASASPRRSARRVYDALARIHAAGTHAAHRRGGAAPGADRWQRARSRSATAWSGALMKLGNLIIAGIVTGSIYASFAAASRSGTACATSSTSPSATSR